MPIPCQYLANTTNTTNTANTLGSRGAIILYL